MKKLRSNAPSTSTRASISGLDYDILQTISTHGKPAGSWTLHFVLREQGHTISAPTIGRRLRDLEIRGMLSPPTNGGRRLTRTGEELLKRTKEQRHIQISTEKLLSSLERNSRKDLIDLLVARRAIEGAAAALAAQNANTKSFSVLQKQIENQRSAIFHGAMGVDEDVGFHEALAQGTGNPVLASIVHLLRSNPWLNQVVNAIRAKVGGRRIVDHEGILNAIRVGDSNLARQAMEQHLTNIIHDVEEYWGQVFGKSAK